MASRFRNDVNIRDSAKLKRYFQNVDKTIAKRLSVFNEWCYATKKNVFSLLVLSLPRRMEVDVKLRQVYFHCRVDGSVLWELSWKGKPPYNGQVWGVWVVIDFTEELWLWGFRMTDSTFDRLCDAVGPPVLPVTSCPRVLLINVSCDLSMRKKCVHTVLRNTTYVSLKTTNFFFLFYNIWGLFPF